MQPRGRPVRRAHPTRRIAYFCRMNLSRTWLALGLLVVLTALAWWQWPRPARDTSPAADKAFAVRDTAAVDKIFMAAKSGERVLLTRTPAGWRVNDRYPAEAQMTQMLLGTLHDLEVRHPVPRAARDNVIIELSTSSTKVEVYQGNRRTHVFFVGKEALDDIGSHFLADGAEQPYVVFIRGHRGFVHNRFDTKEATWRSRQVFATAPEDLDVLAVQYADDPQASVVIRRNGEQLRMPDLPDADPDKIYTYAAQFANQSVEMFLPTLDPHYRDSLHLLTPPVTITLRARDTTQPVRLRLYRLLDDTGTDNPDRMIGLLGEGPQAEGVTVQKFRLEKLLLRREAFRGESPPTSLNQQSKARN